MTLFSKPPLIVFGTLYPLNIILHHENQQFRGDLADVSAKKEKLLVLKPRLSLTGTPHKPPIMTAEGFCVHEGTACAQYLIERGVPADRILKESTSLIMKTESLPATSVAVLDKVPLRSPENIFFWLSKQK